MPKNARKKRTVRPVVIDWQGRMRKAQQSMAKQGPKRTTTTTKTKNIVKQVAQAVGQVTNSVLPLAEGIPFVGEAVKGVNFIANTVIPFVADLLSVGYNTYDLHGKHFIKLTNGTRPRLLDPTTVLKGEIIMKLPVSPGPEGSRAQKESTLWEMITYHSWKLGVSTTCAATDSGALLFVYVPDPLDTQIDDAGLDNRVEIAMGFARPLVLPIYQSGVFSVPVTNRSYYLREDPGSLRLNIPGNVYVIAAAPVLKDKLPTIRLVSEMHFAKAANGRPDTALYGRVNIDHSTNPVGYDEGNALSPMMQDPTMSQHFSERIVELQTGFPLYGFNIEFANAILVKRGETIIAVGHLMATGIQSVPTEDGIGNIVGWSTKNESPTPAEVSAFIAATESYRTDINSRDGDSSSSLLKFMYTATEDMYVVIATTMGRNFAATVDVIIDRNRTMYQDMYEPAVLRKRLNIEDMKEGVKVSFKPRVPYQPRLVANGTVKIRDNSVVIVPEVQTAVLPPTPSVRAIVTRK